MVSVGIDYMIFIIVLVRVEDLMHRLEETEARGRTSLRLLPKELIGPP